jgi:hypothetical protein
VLPSKEKQRGKKSQNALIGPKHACLDPLKTDGFSLPHPRQIAQAERFV